MSDLLCQECVAAREKETPRPKDLPFERVEYGQWWWEEMRKNLIESTRFLPGERIAYAILVIDGKSLCAAHYAEHRIRERKIQSWDKHQMP